MVRKLPIAEDSLAARREARRFGIAMAAMMPMIATTIKSSINENPAEFNRRARDFCIFAFLVKDLA
jgi:hypothetical protein